MIGMLLGLALAGVQGPDVEVGWEREVVFAERGTSRLAMDIARPLTEGAHRPAMLCLHGGAWTRGHRRQMAPIAEDWARAGYVAATASYRLAPGATWPAQLDDVVAALRWLRAHAGELGLDPERIGATGVSAGGHLALMLGLDEARTASAGGPVRVVVNYFGPTDLRPLEAVRARASVVLELAGEAPFADLSPAAFVSPGDPPVLTLQGREDHLVRPQQAEALHALLRGAAIPHQLELLDGEGHGWRGDVLRHTQAIARAFADRYLRPDAPLLADEDFTAPPAAFELFAPAAWEHRADGRPRLALARKSDYEPPHRSPTALAILREPAVADFVLDVDARSTTAEYPHRDLCLVFGWQSPSRFYYAHLASKADERAHGVFLVDGADRRNLTQTRSDGLRWGERWHRLRLRREVASGRIEVFADDFTAPVITATDSTLGAGRVGIGSFDDQGEFAALRLYGVRVGG